MGILMGALAGAGKAAGEIADANTRRWDRQALADQNAQLEMAKMKMAEEMRNNSVIAAEKRAEEPLKRFGGILQGNQNAMITTPGAAPDASAYEGIKIDGWSKGGDIENALKSAQSIKDPQARKEALDQIQSQINTQGDAIRASVKPVTRKVTSEEALQKTREDSLASDPVALAAYEKSIGKSMRDDRRLDTQDAKASAQMDFNNRRLTSQDIKNEQQADFNNRRLEKLDQLQEYKSQAEDARNARLEGKQDTAMQRAELNSRRQSVVELMKSTEHEIERTMTLAGSALDPAAAKGFQDRVTRLTKDLTAYRSALETFSDGAVKRDSSSEVSQPAPPQAAIERLLKNPDKKADFDQLFGPGSADKYLKSPEKKTPILDAGRAVDEDGIPMPVGQRKLPTPYGVPSIKPYQGKSVTTPFNPN